MATADDPTGTTNETAGTPGVAISDTVLVQEARISGSLQAAVLRRELATSRSNRSRARHLAAFGDRLARVIALVTDDTASERSDGVRRPDTSAGHRRLTPRAARALAARDLAQTANASAGRLPPNATEDAGLDSGLFARQTRASQAVLRNETGGWWGDGHGTAGPNRTDRRDGRDPDERREEYGWPGANDSFLVGADDPWWRADQHLGEEGWSAPRDWYRSDSNFGVPDEQYLERARNGSSRYRTGDGRSSEGGWTDDVGSGDWNQSLAGRTEASTSPEGDMPEGSAGGYAAAYGFESPWSGGWSYGGGYGSESADAAGPVGVTQDDAASEDGDRDAGSDVADGGSTTGDASWPRTDGTTSDDATRDSPWGGSYGGSADWGSFDDAAGPSTAGESPGEDRDPSGAGWSPDSPTAGNASDSTWSNDPWTTDAGAEGSAEGDRTDSGSGFDAGW